MFERLEAVPLIKRIENPTMSHRGNLSVLVDQFVLTVFCSKPKVRQHLLQRPGRNGNAMAARKHPIKVVTMFGHNSTFSAKLLGAKRVRLDSLRTLMTSGPLNSSNS